MTIAIPKTITDAVDLIESPERELVSQALTNLFDKAFIEMPDGELFVQTGDIPAMWIRDSTWQVWPLVRFAHDPQVFEVLARVIRAQVKFLTIDPYANAFNIEANGLCWHKDFADQSDWVFERKWELDSITGFFHLSIGLAEASGNKTHLDEEWWQLAQRLVELLAAETNHDPASYRFWRDGAPAHDHLSNRGIGAEFEPCGLIWSAFRPSDDACELPFNIPANIHAYLMLEKLATLADAHTPDLGEQARDLATSLKLAVGQFGVGSVNGAEVFAYEVDGRGNQLFMDDANYPSLLSLPFLGYNRDNLYAATRDFVLSTNNPWYFSGREICGVGSQHTGTQRVWPLAVAMAGLTSDSAREGLEFERQVAETATTDRHIHESISADNHLDFTREWFNWAELTFVELALKNRNLPVR